MVDSLTCILCQTDSISSRNLTNLKTRFAVEPFDPLTFSSNYGACSTCFKIVTTLVTISLKFTNYNVSSDVILTFTTRSVENAKQLRTEQFYQHYSHYYQKPVRLQKIMVPKCVKKSPELGLEFGLK